MKRMDDNELKSNPLYKSVQDYLSKPKTPLPIRRYMGKHEYIQKFIIVLMLVLVVGLPTGNIVFGYNYPKLIKQALVAMHLIKVSPMAESGSTNTPIPPPLVCKNFVNLTEALNHVDIACGLNLSGRGLTQIPADVYKLTKLNDLNLSNNKLTTLPVELLTSFPRLYSLDLSGNHISTISAQAKPLPSVLQNLKLQGNNISPADQTKLKQLLPKTAISY